MSETDAHCLYLRAVELRLCASLYAMMLESAAAEHTARCRLLDGAAQRAAWLIEELPVFPQVAVTSEMQDLARAAALPGPRSLQCSSSIWSDSGLRLERLVGLLDLPGLWSAELILVAAREKQAGRPHLPNLTMSTGALTLAGASTLPSEVPATVHCHRLGA